MIANSSLQAFSSAVRPTPAQTGAAASAAPESAILRTGADGSATTGARPAGMRGALLDRWA